MQVLQLAAGSIFPEVSTAGVERTAYPLDRCYPVDSKPIVGFVTEGSTRLYVAVMHSGVTLAPLMSRLIAKEIVKDTQVVDFEPYRITRDFGNWTHKY